MAVGEMFPTFFFWEFGQKSNCNVFPDGLKINLFIYHLSINTNENHSDSISFEPHSRAFLDVVFE
jgi:hypothetical protein